jgi:peptide/nickel transport system substrate-binding protein
VIVGVRTIPACFDVEQSRCNCPPEALEAHLQTYDTLLRRPLRTDSGGHRSLDPETLQPGLAQSWDQSADGRTVSLQLRRSVLSPAGNELTAHDVKWSWERAFALSSWSARAARLCGVTTPDAVRVAQTYTVQFRLPDPCPLLPALLATAFPPIHDLEEVRRHCPIGDPWGDAWLRGHAAGFGPYTLDEVIVDEEAHLAANANYWEGAAREKRMLLRAIPSGAERADALARGSVDVAADLPAAGIASVGCKPGVRLTQFGSARQVVLRTDPAFEPLGQPKVRQALAAAIPYEVIAGKVFNGAVRPVRAEQDQRRARALLREAGYGSGFRFSLCLPAGSTDLDAVAQAIQLDAIRLNLKIVVERMNPAVFAHQKAERQLPAYLEERQPMGLPVSLDDLEPLPAVHSLLLAEPYSSFASRDNVAGFARRPDGRPRYVELRKL